MDFGHLENIASDCRHGKGTPSKLHTFPYSSSKALLGCVLPESFRESEQFYGAVSGEVPLVLSVIRASAE